MLMAHQNPRKRLRAIVDGPTVIPKETEKALELAQRAIKRAARAEAIARDLIPYVEAAWIRPSGKLYGRGGGAVLRARAALGIGHVAAFRDRDADIEPPRVGELAPGDIWQLGDRLFRLRKMTHREITLRIAGKAAPPPPQTALARVAEVSTVLLVIALLGALVFFSTGCGQAVALELGQPCDVEGWQVCDLTEEIPGFPVVECVGGWVEVVDRCSERCRDDLAGRAWCDADDPPGGWGG